MGFAPQFRMVRQSLCPFCFACILDSYLVVDRFVFFFGVWRNFDVDCICETMIICANKRKKRSKSTSDDSFCTVIVTQVDLKAVKTRCFDAECKETSVCDNKQNPAVLQINPFSVWSVSSTATDGLWWPLIFHLHTSNECLRQWRSPCSEKFQPEEGSL